MSRQLDQKVEARDTAKRNELVKALEFGIAGALESQGIELLGFAIKYDAFNCLLTIKSEIAGVKNVAFVGSDTIINCILKTQAEAQNCRLKWRRDKYFPSDA